VRAVLDPNVVISGLISSTGAPAEVLRAVQSGRVEVIVSPLAIEKLQDALAYPKLRRLIDTDEVSRAAEWLSAVARHMPDPTDAPPRRSQDPDDDHLIALAASSQAALVSGDQHLLALKNEIPVYSPREFIELV
jgi:putative PIN family toxin of toxin-antitoxin system